jgi:peptidoglycan hydrolase-like protein with peptidoglycan-binding domain
MAEIVASVGVGGVNNKSDVTLVQQLLTRAGFDTKGTDGAFGENTRTAIIDFQARFMRSPDGLIEPGGTSFARLQAGAASGSAGAALGGAPASSSGITDWSGDSSKWPQDKKLASLEATFRPKIERVLASLKQQGFQPKIVFGWRSVAVQAQLKREGKTKVSFSFHNAQKPNGTPNAWAVDVVDERWAWNEPDCHKFFRALGATGKAEGLVWGGDWQSFRDWAHLQGRQNSELGMVKRDSGLA